MKTALVALVPLLAILGCSALGATETRRGEIDSLDEGDRLATIDGIRYQISDDVSISDLDEGDNVTMTVERENPYDVIVDIDVADD
jgi:PDZ domain-containing secreted protein